MLRLFQTARTRIIVRLDQFLGWPPWLQIAVVILCTLGLVAVWGALAATLLKVTLREGLWFALARFMDGGTMAQDQGRTTRFIAIGVTTTGILVISFLTGAFASKLGERIEDLRSGQSPIL